MTKQLKFKCDKCGGPVWHDLESAKYYDMSCLYCGKRWFIKKDVYKKVVERKLSGPKASDKRGVLLIS